MKESPKTIMKNNYPSYHRPHSSKKRFILNFFSPSHKCDSGSTLVEVMIVVGLLVSVMLPLLGLLSIGMETGRKAGVNVIGSRIINQLMSEVQQSEWNELDRWNGRTVYFDDQGSPLKTDSAGDLSVTFVGRVYVSAPGVTLATQSSIANDMHRKVTTVVCPAMGDGGNRFFDEALSALEQGKPIPPTVRIGHGLVTNTGKDA
jgi:uncharacterized protein (TIGR02598 family)